MINLTSDCRKFATLFSFLLLGGFASIWSSSDSPNPVESLVSANSINGPAPVQQEIQSVEKPTAELDLLDEPAQSGSIQSENAQDRNNDADPDVDVLMRGPLHEAFASAYQYDPKPAAVVNRQPPEALDELPPEYKPEGNNIVWVPGYWAWDEERDDFIWISGIWRDTPPGQRWVPGYWQFTGEAEDYRWVSGYWTDDQQEQVEYLPQPPASIDNGPSYPAPSDDHFYAPGNWEYQNSAYAWRSGYWAPHVDNRIWIPSQYIWAPNGCIYRPGYWDYGFANRGVLFAPVCFNTPVYRRVNFSYVPTCVINTNFNFLVHLYVRASYRHYYFGDWYGPRYSSLNFCSWSNYYGSYAGRRAYDPLYSYYNCRSSRYNNYQALFWVRNQHNYYRRNAEYRPKHSLRAQVNYTRRDHGHGKHVDAIRRANYGERYDDRIKRDHQYSKTNIRYHKLAKQDRIKEIGQSRELSRQRKAKGQNLLRVDRGKSKVAKLELPKPRPAASNRIKGKKNLRQNPPQLVSNRISDELRRKRGEEANKLDLKRRDQQITERQRRESQLRELRKSQTRAQREVQQLAQKDARQRAIRETQKRAKRQQDQQQRDSVQRAQRDAQQKSHRDAQHRSQRGAQQRAQRGSKQRVQQESQQRAKQQQAQRQRESQQRAKQQQAQRQRESQQRAQRDAQQRAQRDAQQRAQRESKQRAQRESQQRAKQQQAQRQRESQQRAQRDSQRRAQRDAQQKSQRDAQQRAKRSAERKQKQSAKRSKGKNK